MHKNWQVAVAGGLVVLCLLGSVGYGLWRTKFRQNALHSAGVATAQPAPSSSGNGNGSSLDLLPTSNSANGTLGANTDSSQSIGLQSNLGQGENTSKAPVTPGPETFGQYDQYQTSEHSLFGDLVKGTGMEVGNGQKVAVYYKGWLTNGSLFDQSKPGKDGKLEPFMFTIGAHEVIPGWEEGVFGMKVGGTRRVIVPPSVGYGEAGKPPVIPANAVMVFDIQLLDAL